MWIRFYLGALVFACGGVTLGAELAASRLLAPFFGTSLVVWTSLIGLILLALSLGYWLGGRWADRSPTLSRLLFLIMAAAVLVGVAPDLARGGLMRTLQTASATRWGLLLGSFAGVLVLLGAPMVLLGTVSPFAIRLATRQVDEAGRVAGRLYALSTMGSFVGVFLPVLFLIPSIGTRWTFIAFALLLLGMVAVGFLLERQPRRAAMALALGVALGALGWLRSGVPIKSGTRVLFEGESPYQYVRVVEDSHGWRRLQLNEGIVTHSKYHPDLVLTFGEWDYFAVAPMFCPGSCPTNDARRWALIGAGAGTTARLVRRLYPEARIDGVELDPMVVEVGSRFFGERPSEYRVTVQDGRAWLVQNHETYDVIGIDAYRQPYIPFELATVECFQQVREHLRANGVLAMNVVHLPGDDRLVGALTTTLREVFPSVHVLHLGDRLRTSIVVATCRPSELADFRKNLGKSTGLLQVLGLRAGDLIVPRVNPGPVLTDDCAPVERLMDMMLFRHIRDGGAAERRPGTSSAL